jgi:hypothetical protein
MMASTTAENMSAIYPAGETYASYGRAQARMTVILGRAPRLATFTG